MIRRYKNFVPKVPDSCFVFPTAEVIGSVECGENVIIYPSTVVRAGYGKITIGDNTNLQENTTLHVEVGYDISIGSGVTIGHNSIIHGCTIHDNVLIGMGAIIQEGAVVEENCFIGAGAVVKRGMRIPAGHMAYGIPCRVVRPITQAEYDEIRISTAEYQEYMAEYKKQQAEDGKF